MQTRIIALKNPKGKYVARTDYVTRILRPELRGLGLKCDLYPGVETVKRIGGLVEHNGTMYSYRSGSAENFLSHVELWRECERSGEQYLILEDDAQLLPENESNVVSALAVFSARWTYGNHLLYLLSSVPYLQNRLKEYPHMETRDGLCLVPRYWADFAGTAAYALNPTAATALLAAARREEMTPTDQFLQQSINLGLVECIVPKEYGKCFTLHPELYWG